MEKVMYQYNSGGDMTLPLLFPSWGALGILIYELKIDIVNEILYFSTIRIIFLRMNSII